MTDDNVTTLTIINHMDTIKVRMQTREIARKTGLSLQSQACISMAAWSVVDTIGLGQFCRGHVRIESINENGTCGVRVVCVVPDGHRPNLTRDSFSKTRWLLDQFEIEKTLAGGFKVIVTKMEYK